MTRFHAIAYVATLIAFLAVDAAWLSIMGGLLYTPLLAPLLRPTPDFVAAGLFYIVYIAGLVVFAVDAARRTGRWPSAALLGALFGFCAYATYDLTNQATLAAWPPILTVIDLVWGTALSAFAATVGYLVAARLTSSRR